MKYAIEEIKRLIKNIESDIELKKSFNIDTFYLERYNAGLSHAVYIIERHKNISKAAKQVVRNRVNARKIFDT